MSPGYEIYYLQTAEKDLDDIFDHVKEDRPSAALALLGRIDEAVSHLADNPELGVIPKDERLKSLGYRMLIIDKYLVFYVIKEKFIQVRRVIHGARRYEFLL